MPPKTKPETRKIKRPYKFKKDAINQESFAISKESPSLAARRPKREPKVPYDPLRVEEDAQLELAIKLSLKAQRSEKQKKNSQGVDIDTSAKDEEPTKELPTKMVVQKRKLPLKNTDRSMNKAKKEQKVQKRQNTGKKSNKSPTKKVKMEKVEKSVLENKEIPSTASFISYVLQKGSTNRDLDLVKQFERPVPAPVFSSIVNATSTDISGSVTNTLSGEEELEQEDH